MYEGDLGPTGLIMAHVNQISVKVAADELVRRPPLKLVYKGYSPYRVTEDMDLETAGDQYFR